MSDRAVIVRPEKGELAEHVANTFIGLLARLTQLDRDVHVSLTGGSMGIGVLEAVSAHPWRDNIEWQRVHLWWSDERFLPRSDDERNARQARVALLDAISIPAENVHEPAASDDGITLDEAAAAYAAELARFAPVGSDYPTFDVCFLGVGPDGHVASLFPDRAEVTVTEATVLAVRESPKPPPERVSFTRKVINASDRVWLVLAGNDKASALGLVMAGASYASVPAAGAYGTDETIIFTDVAAAAEVPEELIDTD